ncbi:MAG: hypothetical protein AAFV80_21350 [Bacteroidota bacterium]
MKKVLTALLLLTFVGYGVGQTLEYTELEKPKDFRGVESIEGLGYFAFMVNKS